MKPLVVSLYDKTGQMMKPWVAAGRMALSVDLQHPPGLTTNDGEVWRLGADLRPGFKMPDGLPAYSHVEFAALRPPRRQRGSMVQGQGVARAGAVSGPLRHGGKAALREGFGFIGCEMDAAYFAIAEARLAAVKVAA